MVNKCKVILNESSAEF